MKMGVFSLIVLSLSISAGFAADRPNECAVPGVKLSSQFLGLVSDGATLRFSRDGSKDVAFESNFSGEATAVISKSVKNKYCAVQSYTIDEQKCSPVDGELALGRGNKSFRAFYDLSKPLLARAQSFMQLVSYDMTAEPGVRLEAAKIIVARLVALASTTSVPNNWDDFVAGLNTLLESGEVNKVIIDDITTNFLVKNKEVLGFNVMSGVDIKEGAGNDSFKTLFDLSTTEFDRVKVIQAGIKGLAASDKNVLAREFISFASDNGIPANWTQFSLMLKTAVDHKKLDQAEYKDIVNKFEFANRENFGFQVVAVKCVVVQRTAQVNVVNEVTEREFNSRVSKTIKLKITKGALLNDENESFNVYYDGLNPESVTFNSYYNTYTSTQQDGGFVLSGTRVRVSAKNTSYAQIIKSNDVLDINYQNVGYNPKVGGKVVVIAEFYENRFFGDKLLGAREITPADGSLAKYSAQVKMQNPTKKAYVLVKMKYVGSAFYDETFTAPMRFDLQ